MKKVIWLRIYKGQEILKSEDGKVRNENSKVALAYNTLEWDLYLKALPANPYCKVAVEKEFELKDGKYVECEISEKIKKEVLIAHKGETKVILTPEQIEIAELKAQMKELLGKKDEKKEDDDISLEELQKAYTKQENKDVPPRYKNDKVWIKSKLTK